MIWGILIKKLSTNATKYIRSSMENEIKTEIEVKETETETKKEVENKDTHLKSLDSVMKDLQSMLEKQKQATNKEKVETPIDPPVETKVSNAKVVEMSAEEVEDIKKNKKIAWLSYILFFIPLCINRKSPFVRLHANEGLDVFIIDVVASILMICGKFIKFSATSAIFGHLMFLAGLGLIALTSITKIFQIIQVIRGKRNQTPWLWKTRFIK